MSRTIKIFDTTLRDGEQSPGCSMNLREKIQMAHQLEKLNVDIIEAGFAAASPGDLHSIQEIGKAIKNSSVASLARAHKEDIDKAWESLKYAAAPRIHTFIATSQIHMVHKLNMNPEQVTQRAEEMVKYAKQFCSDIEFSAEDATRSDIDFLSHIIEKVIKAGATTINIPDTVGYTTPDEFYDFIKLLKEKTPSLDKVDLSVHCHNDLGLGVANSLAAVRAGATQVECTLNGIGERAGNAAMEEIVMTLNTRKDRYDCITNIVTTEIIKSSKLLSRITGVKVQPNKAIVGANAFAHEAGIHQHGMLSNKSTYEIMTPESVGLKQNIMVLGKHSGRHALRDRIEELGYNLNKEELDYAFSRFKELADKKKQVYNRDIEAIVSGQKIQVPQIYELEEFEIISASNKASRARITLKNNDKRVEFESDGDGPVDAAFTAIEKIVSRKVSLEDYSIQSVTEGEDALGDAMVKVSENGKSFTGRGLSTDIIEASIKAFLNAINKMLRNSEEE